MGVSRTLRDSLLREVLLLQWLVRSLSLSLLLLLLPLSLARSLSRSAAPVAAPRTRVRHHKFLLDSSSYPSIYLSIYLPTPSLSSSLPYLPPPVQQFK